VQIKGIHRNQIARIHEALSSFRLSIPEDGEQNKAHRNMLFLKQRFRKFGEEIKQAELKSKVVYIIEPKNGMWHFLFTFFNLDWAFLFKQNL
jgi:hypothetical protein